ncbi:hypothetical protein HNP37_001650 [Flavobacterium nitrogenifigens]|uniref:Lipoprotein n=2 Tax=Flavobacterium TaxID=237 RepID=A0A7W7N7K8_9FLAO|nr:MULTISPECIES: hypothetical protein [Flavobacterium]MBB4801589.1 hypothetical protein [Flavobacterium nitrogenifigens]MBB6386547.1 hypothetical protein [Flavobacterium notoginsengisoli]
MKAIKGILILILIFLSGLFFSCKNNQDGYSDEIETVISPMDSKLNKAEEKTDSLKSEEHISTNIETTQKNGSESSAGTGSGPGESSQDGATYTTSTGVQKDSLRPEQKVPKKNK